MIRLLRAHGIAVERDGFRILAANEYVDREGQLHREWIDVTKWTGPQIMRWLGY